LHHGLAEILEMTKEVVVMEEVKFGSSSGRWTK